MQIVFHLGAHATDDGDLLRCLLKNRVRLASEGIAVPDPSVYPEFMRLAASAEDMPPLSAEQALSLLAPALQTRRIILSFDSFMGFPRWALKRGRLYPNAALRLQSFQRLFPGYPLAFFVALRNPATYLPTLHARQRDRDYSEFIADTDPSALRWSDLVLRLTDALPDLDLTIWCDEDTPLLWPEIISRVSGVRPEPALEGVEARLAGLMQPAGFARMQAYIAGNPPLNEIHRRRIVSAFLDKFALPSELEMEIDLPGWSEPLVDEISAAYRSDCAMITEMPGLTFLRP